MHQSFLFIFLILSLNDSPGHPGKDTGNEAFSSQLFEEQIEVIIRGFPNNFSGITGEMNIHESDGEEGYLVYNSLVQLGDAEEMFIENDIYSKTYSFYAGFPGSTNPEVTLKAYQDLIGQIESLQFSFYPLIKGNDEINGVKHQMIFSPDTSNKQLDPALEEMIIVIYLDRAIKTNREGKIVWIPFMKIL